jgi:hypothetical protein
MPINSMQDSGLEENGGKYKLTKDDCDENH